MYLEKYNKLDLIAQDQKNVICFWTIFDCWWQIFIYGGLIGHEAVCIIKFALFLKFSDFLRSYVLNCLATT